MIIKSLSRKARQASGGRGNRRGGGSPIASLLRYMNRGIEEEEGRAVLWHNFYGGAQSREEDILQAFEDNARLLSDRKNGNILYHEILSFSVGHQLSKDDLCRVIADIGQEYLRERAADQLAYGVIHLDTDHIHLHLMVSANEVGRSERVRLSKAQFAEAQRRVERFALTHYPELAQTRIYDQERRRERLKTRAHEQAMKERTQAPSRKEQLKASMHQMFERARSFEELGKLLEAAGCRVYVRGKTVGIVVREADGTERKHRLATLGLEDHYHATNARLLAARTKPEELDMNQKRSGASRDAFERPPSAAEIVAEEFLTGELHPEWHGEKPREEPKTYTDAVLQKIREREAELYRAKEQTRQKDKDRDRER